ncbi:MAG: hypothetical protein ACPGVA_16375 [Pikeienuella sp.]
MAKTALVLRETTLLDRLPAEAFELFVDPEVLLDTLGTTALSIRKLDSADRWVMSYPQKLGDKVIDLQRSAIVRPQRLTWLATLRGFEVETTIRFEAKGQTETRLRVVSKVVPKSLRAKLVAPLLKLGERRAQRNLRKGLRKLSETLRRN